MVSGTVSFMGLKLSNSELANTVIEPLLKGLVTNFTGVRTDFGTTAALPGMVGDAKNAQQVRKEAALGALRQVITAVLQGQQTLSAGGQQLQVARTQLLAIENSARAAGFDVYTDGRVEVSQIQRAYCRARWDQGGEGLLRILEGWARNYTAQIRGTLTQASTMDSQIATALVNLASQYLTSLFEKKSDKPADLPTPTIPTPSTPTTPTITNTPPIGTGTTPLPAGGGAAATPGVDTVLAGVGGALGGAGAGGMGPGGSHLSGASLGGVAAGAAALAGTVGGGGMVGVGPGGAGAAGAGRGPGATGLMPMGAGAHGGHGQAAGDHHTENWLVEDDDAWCAGDAPEGVIA